MADRLLVLQLNTLLDEKHKKELQLGKSRSGLLLRRWRKERVMDRLKQEIL